MTSTNPSPKTLVIGGTGTTGSRVVERLEAAGVPVRAVSRSTDPAFSWEDQSTWPAVFAGIDKMYLVHPVLMTPEASDQIGELAKAAADAGVKHIVLLSGYGADDLVAGPEAGVKASGATWTIVRPSWFDQNFETETMQDFRDNIRAGRFETPLGNEVHGFVDAGDIADVVTAALTEPGHEGKSYDLTGPRLISFRQAIAEISEALGREIEFVDLTQDQLRELLAAQGVPSEEIEWRAMADPTVEDALGTGVQDALGRAPKDFADYARDSAASGIWDPQ